jgi:FkbM family methyltransferase
MNMDELIHTPKYKDLIYDVGMHRGEDTQFYLRKGFRVVAFEADPEHVNFCRTKFAEFINQGQLKIVEGAITNLPTVEASRKTVSFYKNEQVSVWGTICPELVERHKKVGARSRIIEVYAVNFEHAIKEHGMPYYMKIDIEGSDMVCLNALRRFRERPDYISIESDKTSFSKIRHEIDLLGELGYHSFQAIEQSGIPMSLSPPFPPREGTYAAQSFELGSSGLFGAELEGDWKSKNQILRQYRVIRIGYFLVGDDGIMKRWRFRGAGRLQSCAKRLLHWFTRAAVPGWYDTHARYSYETNRGVSKKEVAAGEIPVGSSIGRGSGCWTGNSRFVKN